MTGRGRPATDMLPPMSGTVVLHVGLMKSGTTFIQGQLFAHQEALAAAGVLVPGRSWGDQVKGVGAALKATGDLADAAPWQRIAEPVRTHGGTSMVSMEFLGPVEPRKIDRVVASLRPARVEAVVTVRDLNRSIVAQWQETVQNGRWWTFAEYVAAVEAARPGSGSGEAAEAGRTFWRQHDAVRITRNWAAAADRCTVVTVPQPGAAPGVLLGRFSEAAEIDALEVAKVRANVSIGAASTLALRAMNERLAERGLPFPERSHVRKAILAKRVLAARKGEEPAIGLPVRPWVVAAAADLVAGLRGLDVELVGDWSDLTPVDVPGVPVEDVPAAQVLQAAVAGAAGLVRLQ